MGVFAKLFGKPTPPSFFAWQVELTTRCPLQCRMCIRQGSRDWRAADMPFDDFRKLAPYFRRVENIVLQGWGEPLLYPKLVEAIAVVKSAGSRAGFVTSGWGLNAERASALVTAGVDFIGFSLAGATPDTHAAIRVNSRLPDVVAAIETVNRIKADRGRPAPRLHIVYLMLEDNLGEVPDVLDLARRIGIDEVALVNVTHVTDAWQNDQRVFARADGGVEAVLAEARSKAKALGIGLRASAVSPRPVAVCEEDPLRNLFVSVEGWVSPCVYLNPPTSSPMRRIYCGAPVLIDKLAFGNIFTDPLDGIWNSPGYVAFRAAFEARLKRCGAMAALAPIGDAGRDGGGRFALRELPPPPTPCMSCHRMLGF